MQDHRNSLIHDRKAVMSMPIKLLIIMVILSLSIPIVYSAMEFNQESMMDVRMDKECDKIIGCVKEIYYSGTGSIRTIDTELPQGCELVIGGNDGDAYCIRSYYEGKEISKTYMDEPLVKFSEEIRISGHTKLRMMTGLVDNEYVIKVSIA